MKFNLTSVLFVFVYSISFSQVTFDKGYFINNDNQKIECFLKSIESENNLVSFEYKLLEDGDVHTKNINSVKEFGINDTSKFIKAKVDIDRSDSSYDRRPNFESETLFLQVLVEGHANLYFYEDGALIRYFFKTIESPIIEQLVHKSYYTSNNTIAYNNDYRNELWENLKKEGLTISDFEGLLYSKSDLTRIFSKYNGDSNVVLNNKNKKISDVIDFSLLLGARQANAEYADTFGDVHDLGNQINPVFGIETELKFNINKNKLTIVTQAFYQSYNSKLVKDLLGTASDYIIDMEYQSIEIVIGPRYYIHLNSNSKLFINGFVNKNIPINSSTIISYASAPPKDNGVLSVIGTAYGIGYKFKNKFSLEFRNNTHSNIGEKQILNYKNMSLIFCYTLF